MASNSLVYKEKALSFKQLAPWEQSMYNAAERQAMRIFLINNPDDIIAYCIKTEDNIITPSSVIFVTLIRDDTKFLEFNCTHLRVYSEPLPHVLSSTEKVHLKDAQKYFSTITFNHMATQFSQWLRLAFSYESSHHEEALNVYRKLYIKDIHKNE